MNRKLAERSMLKGAPLTAFTMKAGLNITEPIGEYVASGKEGVSFLLAEAGGIFRHRPLMPR
jgi:hypothetical protein